MRIYAIVFGVHRRSAQMHNYHGDMNGWNARWMDRMVEAHRLNSISSIDPSGVNGNGRQ